MRKERKPWLTPTYLRGEKFLSEQETVSPYLIIKVLEQETPGEQSKYSSIAVS